MGIINDEELREIFRVECEEHLQKIEQGLLHLEQHADDSAMLEELLRELHNIKGSSRMLGVEDMESISHGMEDALKAVSHGTMALTPERVDRLEQGLDALLKIAAEAVNGTPSGIAVAEILSVLAIAEPETPAQPTDIAPDTLVESHSAIAVAQPEIATDGLSASVEAVASGLPAEMASSSTDLEPDAEPTVASGMDSADQAQDDTAKPSVPAQVQVQTQTKAPTPVATASATPHQIDTIRVEPKKLDVLASRSGELIVTKTNIERWLARVEILIALREDAVSEISKHGGNGASSDFIDYMDRMGEILYPLRQVAIENSAALNRITEGLESDIRALRLLPMDRVFQLFPRTVRDLSRTLGKNIQLVIQGGDTSADKQLIEMLKDPLMHLIRNAIHHGIETPEQRLKLGKAATASIILRAQRTTVNIAIEVEDDGKGLDVEAIKRTAVERGLVTQEDAASMSEQRLRSLIFASGFSTSSALDDISGRGIGLDVVRTGVERLKGTIKVESKANQGCKFLITLPLSLATTRVFLIMLAGRRYAIPVEFVRVARYVNLDDDIFLVQDQETISLHGEAISVAWLEDLLELPKRLGGTEKTNGRINQQPCLILEANEERLGLFVDEIMEEREIVLKPAGPLLDRVRNVSGITILGSGEVCIVVNAFDLIRSAQKRAHGRATAWKIAAPAASPDPAQKHKTPVILLAEDSITTRTQEKRMLETAGYEVVTAVDGLAAFNILGTRAFDAIVSDIEMPNMDGLTLTSKVREDKAHDKLPIILVTSLASEEDRKRGMDVGADAYIPKSALNQQILIDTLGRLV